MDHNSRIQCKMGSKQQKKGGKKRGHPSSHARADTANGRVGKVLEVNKGIEKDVKEMDLDDLLGIDVSEHDGTSSRGDQGSESAESGSSSEEDDLELTREDMEKLKDTDPEFYNYLKSTDENLLNFDVDDGGDDNDDNGGDSEEEEEEDEGEEVAEEREGATEPDEKANVITSESLKSWCHAAQKNASLGAVRQMTRLYRIACHYGDTDGEEESLRLASSAVYNNILLFMLGKADGIFRKALEISSNDVDATKQPRWAKYEPLVRSYLGNTLHLLGTSKFSRKETAGSSQIPGFDITKTGES